MAQSYIFDSSKGETPQSIARQRELAAMIMGRMRAPQNVGEGLHAMGQALIAGMINREAKEAERAGISQASDRWKGIVSGGMPVAAPAAAATDAAPVPPTAPAVPMSGATGGDVQSYLDAVKAAESGGNPNARNPNSTAGGLYQFTQGTWYDMIRKRPDLGLTPDGRFDPQQQERAMRAFTDQNAGVLTNAGIPINPANLYAAHFLGAGGARGVLRQPDETPMPVAVGPEVVKANPFLANMSVGDFKNWTAKKMGGAQSAPANTASAGAFPAPLPQMDDGAVSAPTPHSGVINDSLSQAGLPLPALYEAAADPFMNPGQRSVINTLIEQRLQEQDPMRQLQVAKLKQDIGRGQAPINVGGGYLYDPNKRNFIRSPGADNGFRKATPEEAASYGAAGGQFDSQGRFYPINPPSGMSIESDGQGGFKLTQGPGAGKKGGFTDGQSKDITYATRAEGALGTLDEFGSALTSPIERAADYDPTGMVRGQQSPEFQKARQAGDEFLQAILRKDTGAAITKAEMDEYGRTYLPAPGDGSDVLAQKQVSRKRALEALKAGMSPQAILNQERALARSGASAPPAAAVNMLRSNPALANQFDQKYGTGAAAKILGTH